jgi:GNAT superfamily N-acetyltransferase
MTNAVRVATSDADIARCFAVMKLLRPHLVEGEFVGVIRRQQETGYRMASLDHGGRVVCVAGYRLVDNLFAGRMLYVDDLVTDETVRSKGHGKGLFDWLVAEAKREGCSRLDLDSAVHRFEAHRFYLVNRMIIGAHHFTMKL